MNRVLVVGYDHYGYPGALVRGFAAHGCQAELHSHPRLSMVKARRTAWVRRWWKCRRVQRENDALLAHAAALRPELVLLINAEPFTPETVQALSRTAVTIGWAVDAIANVPTLPGTWAACRQLVVFEPQDRLQVPRAHYLAYGVEPAWYHRLAEQPIAHDLCFVGAAHVERLPLLEEVAAYCLAQGIRFGVAGPGFTSTRALGGKVLARDYPALARCLAHDGPLTPAGVNQFYNRCHMALNIHHVQSRDGVNPRTFEIPAAGTFELVDHQTRLDEFLVPGREVVCWHDAAELCAQISYYLQHPEERLAIAAAGHQRVHREHRFQDRCARLLAWARGEE
jgi:spore maturation protein CgeB